MSLSISAKLKTVPFVLAAAVSLASGDARNSDPTATDATEPKLQG